MRQGKSTTGNQVQGSTVDRQSCKNKKYIPKCPALALDEYIEMRKEQHGIEEAGDEDIEKNEMEDDMENDINYESDEIERADENEVEGLIRKRGKTLCKNIHARDYKNRQEITLNEEGQPIGPDEKRVAELSSFLGTIARSADLCPLTFNNWKALVKSWEDEEIDPVWEYVNEKYIIPEKGKKNVFAIVNDAWRRYKHLIKKNHFTKYKTMRERLKNRPEEVPEEDFKKLLVYWRDENSQEVSLQNAQNIAQLKWRHRTGNKAFAVIREKMRVSNEDKEPPSQAEMFIATRQSKKGKELDQETNIAITKLQDLIEKYGKPSEEAFQSVCGKEKPGRLRCHGRTTTPTLLKRNEEIARLRKEHNDEVKQLKDHIQEMEEKQRKETEAMEGKIQILLKAMLSQNTTGLDTEALADLITTPAADANNVLHSSTSTFAPDDNEMNNDDIDEEFEDLEAQD